MSLKFQLEFDLDQFYNYMYQAPVGYLVIDENGKVQAINQLFLRASHYTEKELVSQPFDKVIDFDGEWKDLKNQLQYYTFNQTLRLSWKGSKGNKGTSKVIVWKLGSTSPQLFALAFLNIHKEKHFSLLSRFAENFVSETSIGIIVVDKDSKLVEISPLSCKIFNLTKEEVLNKRVEEVFFDIPDEQLVCKRTLLDGIRLRNHAMTYSINKQRYDLLVDSNTIKDESGNIVGAYVLFKDVTNLRSLEQQVLQNDRLATIGQIAAGTAHEIRNPLTSIRGFLQILKDVLIENQLMNELQYTDIMLTEIDRINKLVNEILLLGKPKHTTYKQVDVNKVLLEVLPIIENHGMLHGVEVNYLLGSGLPTIVADPELLKQVFLNIAKNGIEAIIDGGVVTVTTKLDEDNKRILVMIQDNGPGIPNYLVDKIFDPFFTTKEKGTGLGLSISQKIIHDLGGSIRVSTKGFGTTFQINLPYN
ncbi:ATP-binding protein [Tepidibacillus fermentans]|uniref:histidine kinase n=1 Tax=Tepidibacillus fermentans TaxID=1281767 RepID=A0A4R3K5M8_9BACI|nr:ATP-binding protein [Tepidibacillus fermentans]TCS78138.1 PAS domain S-box-containing protein [Tepidibacillus fermentans]